MAVSFNNGLGAWQIDGRGFYNTKAEALAAEASGSNKAQTSLSSAEFKQASSVVMNVKRPPLTPEEQAVDQLAQLRATRATYVAKKAPASVLKLVDAQIAGIYRQYPNIAKREDAAEAANRAKFQRYQTEYLKGRAADAKSAKAVHDYLMANDPAYAAGQRYIASAGTDWSIFVAGAKVIAAGAAVIATGGAAAGALAGGITAAGALTAAAGVATAAKTVSAVAQGTPPPLSATLPASGVVGAVSSAVRAAAPVAAVVSAVQSLPGAASDLLASGVKAGVELASSGGVTVRAAVSAAAPAAPAPAAAPKAAPAPAAAPVAPAAPKAAPAPAAAPVAPAAPKAAPAPAPVALQLEQGFVVTPDARVLDGVRWAPDDAGSLGVLVRITGPAALRRDATVRRWRNA